MIVKLMTEHHLEFLSLRGGFRGSSESTHVKMHIVGNLMYWLNYFLLQIMDITGKNGTRTIKHFYKTNKSHYTSTVQSITAIFLPF